MRDFNNTTLALDSLNNEVHTYKHYQSKGMCTIR